MISKIYEIINMINSDEINVMDAIQMCINNPSMYSFVKLLENEKIKNLKEDSFNKKFYDLLILFCYGNYNDYIKEMVKYPNLTDIQIKKLRQLTILYMAMHNEALQYSDIYSEIGLNNHRDIEPMILDMMYDNLIEGYFDQENEKFHIKSTTGRDVPIEAIPEIESKLVLWGEKCDTMIEKLNQEFSKANNFKAQYRMEQQQVAINYKKAKDEMAQVLRKEMAAKGGDSAARSGDLYGSGSSYSQSGKEGTAGSAGGASSGTGCASGAGGSTSSAKASKKGLLRNLKKK